MLCCTLLSVQAVEQLNFKTKSFKDLLTDESFTRKDIITLQVSLCLLLFICSLNLEKVNARVFFPQQDPTNLDKFNVSSFYHVKNDLKLLDPGEVFF